MLSITSVFCSHSSSFILRYADIKYGYISREDRFFFLLSIIDVYDRAIIDYHIGLSCEAKHAVELLQRALWKRKQFEEKYRSRIRVLNCMEYTSQLLRFL